jgi:uncharacterized protein YbbC (DUF1343 family)
MCRRHLYKIILSFLLFACLPAVAQHGQNAVQGAWQLDSYLHLLKDKKVALLINQTSVVAHTSLLDTLLKRKVKVVKVLVPEHGFRGKAEAGEKVESSTDVETGLPVLSLYGKTKKPTKEMLSGVDVLVYDLQDVGVRFYTYISTMQYAMEACAEYNKKFLVLDRPNPNGNYIDGPVLDISLRSFVGMQPVPVVYGMTAGEYAKMLKGENWFKNAAKLDLHVVPCKNYDHNTLYELPVNPSPNLRNMAAVYCYPSLCFFEGTIVSVGRGTAAPFQQWGHPDFMGKTVYSFMPVTTQGSPEPLYANRNCYGQIAAIDPDEAQRVIRKKIRLFWLVRAYEWYPYKEKFFNDFFEKLAGTKELRKQVEKGMSEEDIRATWQKDIAVFKQIRKKYLLYADFE